LPSDMKVIVKPVWVSFFFNFQVVLFVYMYIYGIIIQDYDRGFGLFTICWHVILGIVLHPAAFLLENASIVYALLVDTKHFDIIKR
jgi:hypothetical protein